MSFLVQSDRWTLEPGETIKYIDCYEHCPRYSAARSCSCLCVYLCVSYPSLWPVELFKNILEVLHGSVCYQHDGLVTQTALAQRCSLNTHTHYAHARFTSIAGNAVCIVKTQQLLWLLQREAQTSLRILKDSFIAFFTMPSPLTWSCSIKSLKCCKEKCNK